jgi:hypothetical protein
LEQAAQPVQSAIDAHPGGILVEAKNGSDLPQTPLFQESEHDRRPIRLVEIVEDIIQLWPNLLPNAIR